MFTRGVACQKQHKLYLIACNAIFKAMTCLVGMETVATDDDGPHYQHEILQDVCTVREHRSHLAHTLLKLHMRQ